MTRLSEAELWFAYGRLILPDVTPDPPAIAEEFVCEPLEVTVLWCPRHQLVFDDECPGEREAVG